jgi:hypothetical protein
MTESTEYIDISTSAKMLGVHVGTIYYRIKTGKIIPIQIGKTYYLTIDQIEHEKKLEREKRSNGENEVSEDAT